MSNTDLLQFIGILAAFATFIGSLWVQEQRRRHDLLREKLETMIKHLHVIAWSPMSLKTTVLESTWLEGPEEAFRRLKSAYDGGLIQLNSAVGQIMSITEVYFPQYSESIEDLANSVAEINESIQDQEPRKFLDSTSQLMKKTGVFIDVIHREFAVTTKSTHIPSEL